MMNVRVSLSAAEMNPDTGFSLKEINISFLAVTACVRFACTK